MKNRREKKGKNGSRIEFLGREADQGGEFWREEVDGVVFMIVSLIGQVMNSEGWEPYTHIPTYPYTHIGFPTLYGYRGTSLTLYGL